MYFPKLRLCQQTSLKLQNKTGSHRDGKCESFLGIGSFEQFITNRLITHVPHKTVYYVYMRFYNKRRMFIIFPCVPVHFVAAIESFRTPLSLFLYVYIYYFYYLVDKINLHSPALKLCIVHKTMYHACFVCHLMNGRKHTFFYIPRF